ncbi:MAG: phosphoglucosamine mutase [Oscillospiraceae bacterium]|nr:phosphoglucosamine mutase [Oscillospiraceae bacterium]
MGKYFGTDGIRGVVGETLTADLAYRTGLAVGSILKKEKESEKPCVLIAKDTRISGDMLEAALTAGLCAAGADAAICGILPTPAVAYLTIKTGCDMGIMISASHNPYEHNGIKIFGKDGFKLSDAQEIEIERLIDEGVNTVLKSSELGRVGRDDGRLAYDYLQFLVSKSEWRYTGKIAVDCANGSAAITARQLFSGLNPGAEDLEIIAEAPDGVNINENCGSTHVETLQAKVKAEKFDVGFAFDGDADRCLVVDEHGELVDGDILLAIFSRDMKTKGKLAGNGVVGTILSNSGMDVFARENGFEFHRADVGDRHVLEMMLETGCNLGGETSGHVIFLDDSATGDGQLVAVKLLNILAESGKPLSELARDIPRMSQVMPSYRLSGGKEERDAIMANPKLLEAVARQNERFKGEGRVLIRPSGTEPLIRVLVEAKTEEEARTTAEYFVDLIKSI